MKRILSLFLAIMIMVNSLPIQVFAQEVTFVDDTETIQQIVLNNTEVSTGEDDIQWEKIESEVTEEKITQEDTEQVPEQPDAQPEEGATDATDQEVSQPELDNEPEQTPVPEEEFPQETPDASEETPEQIPENEQIPDQPEDETDQPADLPSETPVEDEVTDDETITDEELEIEEEAEELEPVYLQEATTPEVTRAQWIQDLVAEFGMFVEEDNYPDNYYSDISAEDDFYRDIMVAIEFGIIDIDAGLPFQPYAAATREFAAQTLNYALQYQLDEGAQYTFAESATVKYPKDIQVAVNRGWFSLVGGAFLPEQPITDAERKAMLADVESILLDEIIDTEHQNTIEVAKSVTIIPEGTVIEFVDMDVIEITDCPVFLQKNDIFKADYNGIPIVYKVDNLYIKDNITTVYCSKDGTEEYITDIDFEGTFDVDLETFEGTGATTFSVNDDTIAYAEPTVYGIGYDKNEKVLTASKTIKLDDGVTATICFEMSNMKIDVKAKPGNYYFSLKGDTTHTLSLNADLLENVKPQTLVLGTVSVYGVGKITLAVEISVTGEISLIWSGDLKAGFSYKKADGFRIVKEFKKKEFCLITETKVKLGFRLTAEIDVLVISAAVYANIGTDTTINNKYYNVGTPLHCFDADAFLYAGVGAYGNIIGVYKFNEYYAIFNKSNSPAKVHIHYEDGEFVNECTRGKKAEGNDATSSDFYTPVTSKNFTPSSKNAKSTYKNSKGETVQIYTYSLNSQKYATITGYKGNASTIVIPSTIDGYDVVAIGENAFKNNTTIRTVKISEGIESININAFNGCKNLSLVFFPESLTYISSFAFANCTKLTELKLPSSLKEIGHSILNGNKKVKEVIIPKSVEEMNYQYSYSGSDKITGGVFAGSSVEKVIFEDGMKTVPEYALNDATSVIEVVIPDSVNKIGKYAFNGATLLTTVNIPEGIETISAYTFRNCSSLETIDLPESIVNINSYAFNGCTSLKAIEIPESVELISTGAFGNCTYLQELKLPSSLKEIGHSILSGSKKVKEVIIPKSVEKMQYQYSYSGSDKITGGVFAGSSVEKVIFEDGMKTVPEYALNDATSVIEVVIPDSVNEIGKYAFNGSTSLTTVNIPEGIETISAYAFRNCSSLKTIDLPESIVNINGYAFNGCTSLKTIEIPESVEFISTGAFGNCTYLQELKLPSSLKEIGHAILSGSKKVKEVIIPKSVEKMNYQYSYSGSDKITGGVFAGSSVEKVIFEDGMKTVPEYALNDATSVIEVVIPDSVNEIGKYAFNGSTSLTTVNIPEGIETIFAYTFRNCSSLETIGLPESIVNINGYAFNGCTSLKTIEIPESVEFIGTGAFGNCTYLQELKLPSSLKEIGHSILSGSKKVKEVIIPKSVEKMNYQYSYSGSDKITGGVFAGSSVEKVIFEDGMKTVPEYALNDATSVIEVVIPDSVNEIGKYAFNGSTSLTTVNIPEGIETISAYTFRNCSSLKTIDLPESIVNINSYAFNGCSSLSKITFDGGRSQWEKVTKGKNWDYNTGSYNLTFTKFDIIAEDSAITLDKVSAKAGETVTVTASLDSCKELVAIYVNGSKITGNTFTVTGDATVTAEFKDKHNIVVTEAVAPTCTETGLTEGQHCSVCRKVFAAQQTVAKLGHNEVTDPAIPATCTTDGQTEGKHCSRCDAVLVKQQVIRATGHKWDAGVVTKEPTETETGRKEYTCETCGEESVEILPVIDHKHSYTTTVIAPTCEEKGYTTHTCRCGDSYTTNYKNALGHKWDNGVVTKEPTETSTGTRKYTCGTCGKTNIETIPTLDHVHKYTNTVVAPTCTEKGYTKHECACGDSYKDNYVNELGHIEVTDKAVKPSCTTDGLTAGSHCSRCDEVLKEQEIVPATGHDILITEGKEATCLKNGLTDKQVCKVCKEVLVEQESIPALGHNETISQAVEPTCTDTGLTEGTHCSRCEKVLKKQTVIKALGHELIENVVERTCAGGGYTEYSCTRCDHTYTDNYTPATDHKYGEFILNDDGTQSRTCEDCGKEIIINPEITDPDQLANLEIVMDKEYLIAELDECADITAVLNYPGIINWTVEGNSIEISAYDDICEFTAVKAGTSYIVATAQFGDYVVTARCRVDVTEPAPIEVIGAAHLTANTVTSNIYSSEYATVEISFDLAQNMMGVAEFMPDTDSGLAIDYAYFTNEAMSDMFELRVVDDKTLAVVPLMDITDADVVKQVKSSYKSEIVVVVDDQELITEELTLKITKKLPTVKATAVKLNSFYYEDVQPLVLTCKDGEIESIEVDYSKETEKAPAIPDWLNLNEDMTVNLCEEITKASGKLYLDVMVEGYAVPAKVAVSVSVANTAPKLKLSATKATFNTYRDNAVETVLTLMSNDKKVAFETIGVYDVRVVDLWEMSEKDAKTYAANDYYEVTSYDEETGVFTLDVYGGMDAISGKVLLEVSVEGSDQTVKLPITVTAYNKAPTFKLSKSSVTINTAYAPAGSTAKVNVTPTPADYAVTTDNFSWVVTDSKNNPVDNALDVSFENGAVTVSANENTLSNGKYKVVFTLDGAAKTVTLNVTVKPVTMKVSKSSVTLNKLADDSAVITLTTTPADYILSEENLTYTVTDSKNNPVDAVDVVFNGKNVTLSVNENSAFNATYKVNFTLEETGKTTAVTVKTLAENKSVIKLSISAKGKLETGYLNKGVTITPKWTNLMQSVDISNNIRVYATAKTKGAVPVDVTDCFNIIATNGTYLLTFKDTDSMETLNPKDKYTVVCEDVTVKGQNVDDTKAVTITFAVTKPKVTQDVKSVNLYLNDRYSRGEFKLTLADKTMPSISSVEIADAKMAEFYQLVDLGGGEYAIEFKDNNIAEKLKTGNIKLNIYLDGNNPVYKTPNSSVSVKVNAVKFKTK